MVHVDYEVVKVPRTGVRANELAPRAALTPSRSGTPEKMSAERKGARGMAMGKCKAMGVLALQSHESARRVGTNGASSGKEAGKSPAPSPIDSGPQGGLNYNLKVTQAGSRQLLTTAYEGRGRHVVIGDDGGADQV